MTDSEIEVVEAMGKWGGGFVQALAEAFRRADLHNFRALRVAFPEYWTKYSEVARKAKREGSSS